MRNLNRVCLVIVMIMCVTALAAMPAVRAGKMEAGTQDWSTVESAMGMQGDVAPDGTIKFTVPRNLSVTLDGVALEPGSDMSSEFVFMKTESGAMMVGEIALLENEVANVTLAVSRSGIAETALHNHLLRESPHIMWMHVHGSGDPVEMAKRLRSITSSLQSQQTPGRAGAPIPGLDTGRLDSTMRATGEAGDGVYVYSIPRRDTIRMNGTALAPEMDISTEISFQPLGNNTAAAIGEFVLEPSEVEPVLRSLAGSGIEVTALHSHMITEEPRLFYLHCWAKGDVATIAGHLRKALDMTNSM